MYRQLRHVFLPGGLHPHIFFLTFCNPFVLALYAMATTRPRGASKPMPRDCATITISAMRIVENSDNTNTYYSPIFIHGFYSNMPLYSSQGIYFRTRISDFIR